jgi:uncharacterized protein (DUF1778 family)
MPTSLRIPREKDKMITNLAKKRGQTKTAFILNAVDEKLGLIKNREKVIRQAAGWLSRDEAIELREAVAVFNKVDEDDWK